MPDTRRENIDRHVRHLIHEPRLGDQHLGSNPLASQLTGPMRRDYRLGRFLRLAATVAPKDCAADQA